MTSKENNILMCAAAMLVLSGLFMLEALDQTHRAGLTKPIFVCVQGVPQGVYPPIPGYYEGITVNTSFEPTCQPYNNTSAICPLGFDRYGPIN